LKKLLDEKNKSQQELLLEAVAKSCCKKLLQKAKDPMMELWYLFKVIRLKMCGTSPVKAF
jgi:hypothetical protein